MLRQDAVITLFPTSYGSQLLCNSCIWLGDEKQLVSLRFLSAYMSYNSEAYSSCFVSSINMCKGIVVDSFEVSETDIWNTCCQVSDLLELHICCPNNAVPKFRTVYFVLLKFWIKMGLICNLQEIPLDVKTCQSVWSDRMVSNTFICKNTVTCVSEQCTHLGDWFKFFCSITAKIVVMHVLGGLCWKNVVFCVTASRSVSSYSLMLLSSLWLSVNKNGYGKTFHIAEGNFITDAGKWVCHCVLNASWSSLFVLWELCIKQANRALFEGEPSTKWCWWVSK